MNAKVLKTRKNVSVINLNNIYININVDYN
jgi:hypothetical protein